MSRFLEFAAYGGPVSVLLSRITAIKTCPQSGYNQTRIYLEGGHVDVSQDPGYVRNEIERAMDGDGGAA